MNNTLKTKYLQRIGQLRRKAWDLLPESDEAGQGLKTRANSELKTAAASSIIRIAGEGSPYQQEFQQAYQRWENGEYSSVNLIATVDGVLTALRDELEQDLLDDRETLVRAEVFKDFLEMAQHLLEAGYKDPAATLVGRSA